VANAPEKTKIGEKFLDGIDFESTKDLEELSIDLQQESSSLKWEVFAYRLIQLVSSCPKLKKINLSASNLGLFPSSVENFFDIMRGFPL
jgi:hypothetical protein